MKQVLYSFAALLVPFVAWGTYLTVQQNAFIHSLSEENASFGKMGSELSHLLITAAFLTALVLYRVLAIRYLYLPLGDFLLPTLAWKNRKTLKWSAKERQMRVERFAVCFFKFTYFVASTSAGFYLFWNNEWFPNLFGGKAESIRPLFESFPFVPISDSVILYYMCQLAYHTHSLLYQFTKAQRNDFLEMVVHHVCTIFLVLFSYFNGYHRVGCVVFWLHDVADVWVYASKASIDTDHVLVMLSSYFILLGSWGYLRLYAFPRALLQMPVFWEGVAMSKAYQFSPNVVNTSIHNIQVAMLWMLIVLHYMWYGMFVQIGYAFFAKGVKEDTQAKIMVESLEGEAQGEKDHNDSKDCNSEPVKQNTPQISELRKRLQQIVN